MNPVGNLLFPNEQPDYKKIPPVFFSDLKLEGICKAILSKYIEFDLEKYFYTFPTLPGTIEYRQDIYRDFEKNPDFLLAVKRYTNQMLEAEKTYRFFVQIEDKTKKGSYLLRAGYSYLCALTHLKESLENAGIHSQGLRQLQEHLNQKFSSPEFISFRQSVEQAFSYMEQLSLLITVKRKELRVLEEEEPDVGIMAGLKKLLCAFGTDGGVQWEKEDSVENLFPAPLETSPLENTIVDILKKSRPQVFEKLRSFADIPFVIEEEYIELKNELMFFVSMLEFEKLVNDAGFHLTFPTSSRENTFSGKGIYDLALAWKNRFSDYKIVPNDISYEKGSSFLVITGPNQGGKTTMARAIGQSVYFMKMGLKVPCRQMNCGYFHEILTHFEVEESVETGAGKLKEELQRLRPMMKRKYEGNESKNFVILNELFTTATTYDAQIMAQKVMKHFISCGCLGIYVTHIRELANEEALEGVQSMVAQVDENDPAKRTFKILPGKAEGLGYSDSIVKKYELSLEQMQRRIAKL